MRDIAMHPSPSPAQWVAHRMEGHPLSHTHTQPSWTFRPHTHPAIPEEILERQVQGGGRVPAGCLGLGPHPRPRVLVVSAQTSFRAAASFRLGTQDVRKARWHRPPRRPAVQLLQPAPRSRLCPCCRHRLRHSRPGGLGCWGRHREWVRRAVRGHMVATHEPL